MEHYEMTLAQAYMERLIRYLINVFLPSYHLKRKPRKREKINSTGGEG